MLFAARSLSMALAAVMPWGIMEIHCFTGTRTDVVTPMVMSGLDKCRATMAMRITAMRNTGMVWKVR